MNTNIPNRRLLILIHFQVARIFRQPNVFSLDLKGRKGTSSEQDSTRFKAD